MHSYQFISFVVVANYPQTGPEYIIAWSGSTLCWRCTQRWAMYYF